MENDGVRELAESLMPIGEDPQALLATIGELLDQIQRSRTAQLVQAKSPESTSPSRIAAPLIAQNKLIGYLYAGMDATYGSFNESDRDMLGMLANSKPDLGQK